MKTRQIDQRWPPRVVAIGAVPERDFPALLLALRAFARSRGLKHRCDTAADG